MNLGFFCLFVFLRCGGSPVFEKYKTRFFRGAPEGITTVSRDARSRSSTHRVAAQDHDREQCGDRHRRLVNLSSLSDRGSWTVAGRTLHAADQETLPVA